MKQVLGVEVQPTVVKEPVLNVPAIDMTDVVARPKSATARNVKKSARRSTRRASSTAQATAQPKRTRNGSVGRETFEQVEALVKQGKNKTAAFEQIAEDTGRNRGTVAANYYRVARASGAVRSRKRRGKAASAPSPRVRQKAAQSVSRRASASAGNGGGRVDQIAAQLVASVQALTEAVKAQDAEVKELRGRLDGVRGLLG